MPSRIAKIVCATSILMLDPIAAWAQSNIASANSGPGYVDDQRLRAATVADGNWMTFGRDYSNQRFAPLSKIHRGNVAQLAPAWAYQLGTTGSTLCIKTL